MTVKSILSGIDNINTWYDTLVSSLLAPYLPVENLESLPFFSRNMFWFVKLIIVTTPLLFVLLTLKFIFHDKKWLNIFIYLITLVVGTSLLAIYIGLMQLLFA